MNRAEQQKQCLETGIMDWDQLLNEARVISISIDYADEAELHEFKDGSLSEFDHKNKTLTTYESKP